MAQKLFLAVVTLPALVCVCVAAVAPYNDHRVFSEYEFRNEVERRLHPGSSQQEIVDFFTSLSVDGTTNEYWEGEFNARIKDRAEILYHRDPRPAVLGDAGVAPDALVLSAYVNNNTETITFTLDFCSDSFSI